jgi:hypothetical protein
MDKQLRLSEIARQKESVKLYADKIIFGRKGMLSKGYRCDYINYGLSIEVSHDNVILKGLDCDMPSDISVVIPANVELLKDMILFIRDAIVFFRSERYRNGDAGEDFLFDFDFARDITVSQGVYGSRFSGAVMSNGLRFTICKSRHISLSPVLESRVGGDLIIGSGNIRFPDGVALFAKLLKVIESVKSVVFINNAID